MTPYVPYDGELPDADFPVDAFQPVDQHMKRPGWYAGALADAWRAEHGDEPFPE